jgi:hypothetical protein
MNSRLALKTTFQIQNLPHEILAQRVGASLMSWGAMLFFDWWGLGSTVADVYRNIQPRTIFRRGREDDRRLAGMISMALGSVFVVMALGLWIAGA